MATTNLINNAGTWELLKISPITGGTFSLYVNKRQKLGAVKWQGSGTSLSAGVYSFTYSELITAAFTVLLPVYPTSAVGYLEVASGSASLRTEVASTWSSCTVIFPVSTIV